MTKKQFSDLEPVELELLAVLAEEMGETIQVIGKILRHGLYSSDPTQKESPYNAELLEKELGDVQAATELLIDAGVIDLGEIESASGAKLNKICKYLHHYKGKLAPKPIAAAEN